jgi:methionine-rich copper-binding protein CopC
MVGTLRSAGLLFLFLVLAPGSVLAHAFPEQAEPAVGATVEHSPDTVRIQFDADLEPAFSTLHVLNGQGQPVGQTASLVDPRQSRLLVARLPPLGPGIYKVVWRVVAVDGHVTQGEYTFTVRQ